MPYSLVILQSPEKNLGICLLPGESKGGNPIAIAHGKSVIYLNFACCVQLRVAVTLYGTLEMWKKYRIMPAFCCKGNSQLCYQSF